MESLAPQALAEEWDNVGLQVGNPAYRVKSIWIALDPTYAVVKAACQKKVDLLITHHPLLFKPLRSLNFNTPVGSIIDLAVQHQLAIFAAHTNLDSALGGINDLLANRIGVYELKPLVTARENRCLILTVYGPRNIERPICVVLDHLGSETGYRIKPAASLMSVDEMASNEGSEKEIKKDKIRIKIKLGPHELPILTEALSAFQSDVPIWYDVHPLLNPNETVGIGRIGSLKKNLDLKSLAQMIKKKLKLKQLRFAGDPALPVKKVAICSGSGASLLADFFKSGAQVFISGDLRYHDARDVESANLGLVDIGHFPSEHLIVHVLAERLGSLLSESEMNVEVEACDLERDPFRIL
jgi:dinuclear metal center YbgI/SA1388 family protein